MNEDENNDPRRYKTEIPGYEPEPGIDSAEEVEKARAEEADVPVRRADDKAETADPEDDGPDPDEDTPEDMPNEDMPEDVIGDIRIALSRGLALLGQLYIVRKDHPGLTHEALAGKMNVSRGMIWQLSTTLAAMEDGTVPKSPSSAENVKAQLEGFLARHDGNLHETTVEYIQSLISDCETVMDQRAGIYVYTLPHYEDHMMSPARGEYEQHDRTLYKVGMTRVDAGGRIKQQKTGMPEPPIHVRTYGCGRKDPAKVESDMHRLLEEFGHGRNYQAGGGREWFLTSLYALDALAEVMGLRTEFSIDDEDFDEE